MAQHGATNMGCIESSLFDEYQVIIHEVDCWRRKSSIAAALANALVSTAPHFPTKSK